jgi:hypothetical protein
MNKGKVRFDSLKHGDYFASFRRKDISTGLVEPSPTSIWRKISLVYTTKGHTIKMQPFAVQLSDVDQMTESLLVAPDHMVTPIKVTNIKYIRKVVKIGRC